jgi:uncharacterized membrane protein YiaA
MKKWRNVMNLNRITATTVTMFLTAGFLFLVGTYTENSGFQFAGFIFAVVALITALNQATSTSNSGDEKEKPH